MTHDRDLTADQVATDPAPVGPDEPPSDRERPAAPAPPGSGSPVRRRGRARTEYLTWRLRRVLRRRGDILAVIAGGGAVGSLARWGLTQLLPHRSGTLPWATFIANVTGCYLLGVLMVFVIDVWPPSRYVRPFLGVGVLGGYTTFSTYMLDARALLVAHRTATAGAYVFGSLAAGLAAVWLGVSGARFAVRLARRRTVPSRTGRGRSGSSQGPDPSVRSAASITRSPR